MTRQFALFPVLLLSCCTVFAQAPATAGNHASAVTSANGPEVQEFQKIEDAWSTAVNNRDQYALELVLSPLFVDISASGDISTRNQQLASVITGDDKTLHLTQRVITVRMLGDAAVTNGTYSLHHKVGSKELDEKGVFTHVYERQRGTWICVNSQRTTLRQQEPETGKKKKKPSTAEEPFHFPLFSHGDKSNQ